MGVRASLFVGVATIGALAALVQTTSGAPGSARAKITIWATPAVIGSIYGGSTYAGTSNTTGAMISEQRDVEVGANGAIRFAEVAATLDPASIQLRDITDPTSTFSEQRFMPGATTPTEILARHVGESITVTTTKGEVTGVLRSADEHVIVLEIGSGDQRRLQIMRRDGYVQDVKLPPGPGVDRPTVLARLMSKKQGKHTIEMTYRAEGMQWTADYLAVLDENGTTVDFSAWATVKNTTGATFEDAELTLVNGGAGPTVVNPYSGVASRSPGTGPVRFKIAQPTRIASNQSVQVELFPPRQKAKSRTIVLFEAMPDPSLGFQSYPNTDCNQFNGVGMGSGRAEVAVELDVPTKDPLPDGRLRAFRRKPDRLEVVSEDTLRSSAGVARIKLTQDNDIAGERKAITCNYDERTRTVTEKVEVKIENKSKRPAEIVIREFAWRWPVWRLASEDTKSTKAGPQTLEYRAQVAPSTKRTVTYSVVYTW